MNKENKINSKEIIKVKKIKKTIKKKIKKKKGENKRSRN
jgi:hypothetical protein